MMKMKYAKQAGSVLLAALLGVSGMMATCSFAIAEEETEATDTEVVAEKEDTEAASETETEQNDGEVEITEVEISLGEATLTVTNKTGVLVESVEVSDSGADGADKAEANSESADETEAETETEMEISEVAEISEDGTGIIFTMEDGTVHSFVIADVDGLLELSDLMLTEKIGFYFLSGTDAKGDTKNYYETAEEITLEGSVTMYTTGQITVRESADGSSEALGYLDRGSEVEVLGGTSSWFLISQGDLSGYVVARYLTMDESEAQAAVEAEETAQAAAEAAAAAQAAAVQAAAAQAAAAAAAQSSSDSGSSDSETSSTDNACLTGGVLY